MQLRALPFICLWFLSLQLAPLQAAPSDLDPTFGTGGKVTTPFFEGTNEHGRAVVVLPDGKILVGGTAVFTNSSGCALARYSESGVLDPSFGNGGKVTELASYNQFAELNGMVVQSDGKIVVAGSMANNSYDSDFVVARFTANGNLDPSFGTGGVVTTSMSAGKDVAYGVTLQSDGKIVVAGSATNNNEDFAVARYTASGALDTGFGTSGKVITAFGNGYDVARCVAVQGDGRIVAAGRTVVNGKSTFGLTRYLSDGSLDTTFGTNGKVTSALSDDSLAYGLLIEASGRLLVAGGSEGKFVVARYLPDGSLDPSFGVDGKSPVPAGDSYSIGYGLARQSDGRIVVTGYEDSEAANHFAVARYTPDGMLDASFGVDGFVITPVGDDDSFGSSIAVQEDQRILVAGQTRNGNSNDFAVVRYLGDGVTQVPTLTAPASSAAVREPVTVAFNLLEAAKDGTVTLTFSGAVMRTLTLANTQGTKGAHSFTFDPAQPMASSAVSSMSGGMSIPDGVYDVELSYQDIWANPAATASSSGVRIDTMAPALSLPDDIIAEAVGTNGATVSYSASASDTGGSGLASSSFLPVSGGTFSIGTTMVNGTATDNVGNVATGSFKVKVQDTTPPVVTVPENVTVPATLANGANVSFAVSASDVVDGMVTATPDHASGSVFPVGTTKVNVSASDIRGNIGNASFTVTVMPSSDVTLATLGVTDAGLTPAFAPATTAYTATVGYTVTEATVSAAASFPGATVQQTPPNPVTLAVGTNEVQVSVTAQDGTTVRAYTLAIQRTRRDAAKPMVKIVKPAAGKVTGTFAISGSVKETIGLASVTVQLNGGPRVPAVFASDVGAGIAWSIDGWVPENGPNTILVTATDYNGNVGTATRTVTYIDPGVAPLAGTYLALIRPVGVVDANYVGLVTLQVSASGAFTGKGASSGFAGSFKGVLQSDGGARFQPSLTPGIHLFDRVSKTYLGVLELAVDAAGLSGSLSTVPGDSQIPPVTFVTFAGAKSPYGKTKSVSASLTGAYHVAFELKTRDDSLPAGSGFVVTTIGKTGGVAVAGRLADGSRLSVSSRLREDDTVPVFSSLYRKGGAFIGTLRFAPSPDAEVTGSDFQWLRPELPEAPYYSSGWPHGQEMTAFGTHYLAPASLNFGQGNADPINGNSRLTWSGGGRSNTINKPVSVDPGPISPGEVKLIPPSATIAGYQLRLSPKTGLFSGTFTDSFGVRESFYGLILNRGIHRGGYGYFGATGVGGRVFLDPAGP